MILVEIGAGGRTGLGYTYADRGLVPLIRDNLAEVVIGADALDIPAHWTAMRVRLRNLGYPGLSAMALAAVDLALWDLKARLVGLPVASLVGACRRKVPAYGSGGFTSYSPEQLARQLGGWVSSGFSMVKMKVGRNPAADPERVRSAREAIGREAGLFVDANGAYDRKQSSALRRGIRGIRCDLVRGTGQFG